jgi:hypothetical protein
MWPHKRAFRRAARFDGVFPIKQDTTPLTPGDIREIRSYVLAHRTNDEPFDVSAGGSQLDGGEPPSAFEAAGATWWQEFIGFPGITPDEWLDVVSQGPPAG